MCAYAFCGAEAEDELEPPRRRAQPGQPPQGLEHPGGGGGDYGAQDAPSAGREGGAAFAGGAAPAPAPTGSRHAGPAQRVRSAQAAGDARGRLGAAPVTRLSRCTDVVRNVLQTPAQRILSCASTELCGNSSIVSQTLQGSISARCLDRSSTAVMHHQATPTVRKHSNFHVLLVTMGAGSGQNSAGSGNPAGRGHGRGPLLPADEPEASQWAGPHGGLSPPGGVGSITCHPTHTLFSEST